MLPQFENKGQITKVEGGLEAYVLKTKDAHVFRVTYKTSTIYKSAGGPDDEPITREESLDFHVSNKLDRIIFPKFMTPMVNGVIINYDNLLKIEIAKNVIVNSFQLSDSGKVIIDFKVKGSVTGQYTMIVIIDGRPLACKVMLKDDFEIEIDISTSSMHDRQLNVAYTLIAVYSLIKMLLTTEG